MQICILVQACVHSLVKIHIESIWSITVITWKSFQRFGSENEIQTKFNGPCCFHPRAMGLHMKYRLIMVNNYVIIWNSVEPFWSYEADTKCG